MIVWRDGLCPVPRLMDDTEVVPPVKLLIGWRDGLCPVPRSILGTQALRPLKDSDQFDNAWFDLSGSMQNPKKSCQAREDW